MQEFLQADSVIDFEHPAVRSLAAELGQDAGPQAIAARCFDWVRDRVRHSLDHQDDMVTLTASEVLRHGTGLCYAKSHLLAGLLRANNIPCGFVYQRVSLDESGSVFCLHGLNAVWLREFGWYRMDARGNRHDIATRFDPPSEHLAFTARLPGERTLERVFASPLPVVVSALERYDSMQQLGSNLPDCPAEP